MSFEKISTEKAPKAIGPYSQAVVFGNLVFCSGQVAIVPETGHLIEGGIELQTEQVCKNLQAVLEASGSSLDNVLKTSVFLKNIDDFHSMNGVFAKFFKNFPSRSTVQVSNLPKYALVEIEVIAFK